MALEVCSCGFEALPADLLKAGARYGTQKAKDYVREQTGVDIPTSGKDLARKGKKLALNEANKLKGELLAKAGLPNISIPPLKDLTVEGVKDAVYAGGKPYLDKAIQAETGLPITLPKKLTVKDLENMVGSFFPTNAIEALNLALGIGTQLAASALTSVLAGTAIGSAIPGLGTIVGLAVGLAVAGIKGLFFKAPTHPEGRECKFGNPRVRGGGCPKPPANLNAFQFFTWTSKEMQPLWDGLRQEQGKHPCGRGGAINCVRQLSYMRDVAFGMASATVDSMGLPAIETALAEVLKAPDIKSTSAAGAGFGQGAVTYVTGFRGAQPVSAELRPIVDAKGKLITKLQQRRAKLQAYIKLATSGQIGAESLLLELQAAAIQVQNDPNANAVQWFKMITGFYQQAEKARSAVVGRHEEAGRAAAIEHRRKLDVDPAARAAQIRTNRALCSGGNQAACAELKRLESASTPAPAPTPRAKATPPPPRVVAAAKRVPHTAPPHVKAAAKRVLHRAEQASKKPDVSAILRAVRASAKVDLFHEIFG